MKIPLKQYWTLLIDYLRPQWPMSVALAVLLLANIALQLANPQIMRTFIDVATTTAASPETARTLLRASLLFIGVGLAQQLVSLAATYFGETVGWKSTNALRADLSDHCLHLDMSFHNARTPGEMIERIDGDMNALSNFFSQFVIQVFGNALLLIGVLILLYREDWRIGLAFSAFAGLALASMFSLRNIAVPHWEAERQASAEQFGFLEERLAGTEDIRSSGAKPYVMRRFTELMRALMDKSIKAGLMVSIMVNVTDVLFSVGNGAAFALGAYLYLRPTIVGPAGAGAAISIGTVFIIGWYSTMLMWPIRRIAWQMQELQRAGAGIARIQELLAIQSKIEDAPPDSALPALSGGALALSFRNVTFGYDDAETKAPPQSNGHHLPTTEHATRLPFFQGRRNTQPETRNSKPETHKEIVLHDISFHLRPGAVLGLLGRTGSGKTTLTRLVFRLYDPDQGGVFLGCNGDGLLDVRQIPLLQLRRRVGMVTQNIQLFNASVRDNLTFFDRDIPDARILQVLHDLGLWTWATFRSLPTTSAG